MEKLCYKVVSCSGADSDFPATELNVHTPHTRGWQTPRFCEYVGQRGTIVHKTKLRYPQHVVIELAQDAIISQIQLLSHQNKIVIH